MIGDIRKFRFWCQKVLPLVYDDSLSYYEVLCKIVQYLNKVIEDVNSIPEYIDAVITERLSDEHLQELIEQFLVNIEKAISSNNEGTNTNSSADYNVGQMLWWKGELYRVIRQIDTGDTLITGTNIEVVSFDELFNEFVDDIKHNISANDDGASATATQNWTAGTWVWLNDVLYKAKVNIAQGTAYVLSGDNANVEQITVEGEIENEATAREEADGDLQTAIGDEATAREEADGTLQTAIDNEALAREEGDNELKDYIDNITTFKNVRDYPVSGLNTRFTGTTTSTSNKVLFNQKPDFVKDNGILIANAGNTPNLAPPSNVSAQYIGTPGSASHVYAICKFDNKYGCTPCTQVSVNGCATTLDDENFVRITFDTDANAYGFLLYKDGILVDILSPNIVGVADDWQMEQITAPFNVPTTPPTDYVAGFLKAKVVSVDNLEVEISEPSVMSVASTNIIHDDTEALQQAIDENEFLYIPNGVYNVSITQGVYCLAIPSNREIFGNAGSSIIHSEFSIAHGAMLFNDCNVYDGNNENINIHDLSIGTNYNNTIKVCGISFRVPAVYMAKNSPNLHPTRIKISNCNIQGVSGGITFAGIESGTIENNKITHCIADGCGCYDDCIDCCILYNTIYDTGDDNIGISNSLEVYNSGIKCIGNSCTRTGAHGIRCEGTKLYVAGNNIEYTHLSGIYVHKYLIATTSLVDIIGNSMTRIGEYQGGVAGNHPEVPYDILIEDTAGADPYGFLSQISLIGNELNDANSIHIDGKNATNVITNVQIAANPTISGGDYVVEGVIEPNNIHSFSQKAKGTASIVIAAGSYTTQAVTFSEMPMIPTITVNRTNGSAGDTFGYWISNISKTGFTITAYSANTATFTFNWVAEC